MTKERDRGTERQKGVERVEGGRNGALACVDEGLCVCGLISISASGPAAGARVRGV
jgi:hypothetical protein